MKFLKKAASVVMCAAMALIPCSFAFASDVETTIYVNGADTGIESTDIITRGGYIFAPYDQLFSALGTGMVSSESAKTVTAVTDETQVTFAVGSDQAIITENGTNVYEKIPVSVFEENSTIYVPVRYAAEAIGSNVGWDNTNKAVIISNSDLMLRQHGGSFEIADEITRFFAADVEQGTQKIAGQIDFSGSIVDTEAGETTTLSGALVIDGVSDAANADVSCALKLNEKQLDDILTKLQAGEEAQSIADALKDCSIDFILDGENLILYLYSDLFEAGGLAPNTWIELDMGSMYEQMGLGNLADIAAQASDMSFEEQMKLVIDAVPLDDVIISSSMLESYALALDMMSDSTFTKTDAGYKSTQTTELGAGAYLSMSFNVPCDANGNVTGFGFSYMASQNGTPFMTMEMSSTLTEMTVNMNMNIEDVVTFDANGTITASETTDTIRTKPDSSSSIISLTDLIGMSLENASGSEATVIGITPEDDMTEITETTDNGTITVTVDEAEAILPEASGDEIVTVIE